jgi:hypothetical protein
VLREVVRKGILNERRRFGSFLRSALTAKGVLILRDIATTNKGA